MKPDIYTYPEGASPLELARYMVAVMEAAERGEPVECFDSEGGVEHWTPVLGSARFRSWRNGLLYRIARPVPPKAAKIAEGHNPDGLTEEQVGVSEGWRLLSGAEVHESDDRCWTDEIELWCWSKKQWDNTKWRGANPEQTYRTKKPAGFFLPKPAAAEKPLVPWTLQTVPKNDLLLRRKNHFDGAIILAVGWDRVGVAYSQHGSDTYGELYRSFEYSLDGGATWRPCGSEQ